MFQKRSDHIKVSFVYRSKYLGSYEINYSISNGVGGGPDQMVLKDKIKKQALFFIFKAAQWVRLGRAPRPGKNRLGGRALRLEKASRGPSTVAREGERGTKMKGEWGGQKSNTG